MKFAFHPVVSSDARILILGSMPGELSLARQEYYAHPRNQFWRIMQALYTIPAQAAYLDRLTALKDHRLALWDVLEACERTGSLDSAIKNAVPNDFGGLFDSLHDLTIIAFNGKRARKLFQKWVRQDTSRYQMIELPSTSPAATLPFETKLAAWVQLLAVT